MKHAPMYCGLAAAFLTAIALPARAAPVFTYTSQNRSVFAHADIFPGVPGSFEVNVTKSQTAPDFAPFNAQVTADATGPIFLGFLNEPFGQASQSSVLGSDSMQIVTDAIADDRVSDEVGGQAKSIAKIDFTINVATSYTLSGVVEVSAAPFGQYESIAEIKGPSGITLLPRIDLVEPVVVGEFGPEVRQFINQSGTLLPGQYSLDVQSLADGAENAEAHADLTLTTGATAIPLPSAAYAALPLLGGFGLLGTIRRRRMAVS